MLTHRRMLSVVAALLWYAAPSCSVLIDGAQPGSQLHPAEVQLFNMAGTQIANTDLTAVLSSVWDGGAYPASLCVDGKADTFCHTAAGDPNPQLRISYPCSEGLSKVRVTNRADECCKAQINAFRLRVLDNKGSDTITAYQFAGSENSYTIKTQGEDW